MSISLLASRATPAATCELPTSLTRAVRAIADARTLELDSGRSLRLASLLPPTAYDTATAPGNSTPLAIMPAEAAALKALSVLTWGRNVQISLERQSSDRYGRRVGQALLEELNQAHPQAPEERWVQALLIRDGHGRVTLSPESDLDCARRLLTIEATAEHARRGLWADAAYAIKRAEDTAVLDTLRSTFQIVEGAIQRVSRSRSGAYLNFGKAWKRDFTVWISSKVLEKAGLDPATIRRLTGQAVRVRGWIERHNGPLIRVWHSQQIELLSVATTGLSVRHEPPLLLSQESLATGRDRDRHHSHKKAPPSIR